MGSNPILSATFGPFVVRIRTDSQDGFEKGPNRTQGVARRTAAIAGGRPAACVGRAWAPRGWSRVPVQSARLKLAIQITVI